jgi:hypothetical protein
VFVTLGIQHAMRMRSIAEVRLRKKERKKERRKKEK